MINIFVMDSLKSVLETKNIDIKDYTPAYNGESAGLDLYNAGEKISIEPALKAFQRVLVPTGIRIIVPKGYVALVHERGSVTKTALKVRAGVIDCGYTGEVFVNCVNLSKKEWTFYPGQKLPFQIVVVKCDNEYNIISEEEYLRLTSDAKRKDGSVGSSD